MIARAAGSPDPRARPRRTWRKGSEPPRCRDGSHSPGGGLFSAPSCPGSIVSATTFHFRVRDGNGWVHRALTTRTASIPRRASYRQVPALRVPTPAWTRRSSRPHVAPRGRTGTPAPRRPPEPRSPAPTHRRADATRAGPRGPALVLIAGSGRGIRTPDLRVMSPTSYRCSIPRRTLGRTPVTSRLPTSVAPLAGGERRSPWAFPHEYCARRSSRVRARIPCSGITPVRGEGSSPRPLVLLSSVHCCTYTCSLSSG